MPAGAPPSLLGAATVAQLSMSVHSAWQRAGLITEVCSASQARAQRRLVACAAHKITVLPGDGIGPEIASVAVKVLEAAGDACGESFEFRDELIGGAAM